MPEGTNDPTPWILKVSGCVASRVRSAAWPALLCDLCLVGGIFGISLALFLYGADFETKEGLHTIRGHERTDTATGGIGPVQTT